MSIESISNKTIASVLPNKTANAKSAQAETKTGVNSTQDDTVRLTETAKDMKSASMSSIAQPEIDEKRVADIKAALEAGTYKIDPERVAKKMMDFEIQLTNST